MYNRELCADERCDTGLSGILDTLKSIGGAAVKVLERIGEGGRIVVQPPGFPPVELDTRDPHFYDRLREVSSMIRSSVRYETGERLPTMPEEIGAGVGRFLSSPVGIATAVGAGLLLFTMLRGRRRR